MIYSPLGIYLQSMPYHLRQALILTLLVADKDVRSNRETILNIIRHLYKHIHGGFKTCRKDAHLALLGRYHLIRMYPFLHGLLEVKKTQFTKDGLVEAYLGSYPSYHVRELLLTTYKMLEEAVASKESIIMKDYLGNHIPPEKEFCDEPIEGEEHDAYYQYESQHRLL